MNTETRRIASARLHAERKAAGWRKVTLWLTPEAAFKLDALKAAAGSTDEAVRQAILAWSGPGLGERVARAMAEPAKTLTPNPLTAMRAELQLGPTAPKPGSRLKVKK